MTRQVWKFGAPNPGRILPIHLPAGAVPLSVGMQHGGIWWWAEVDPSAPTEMLHVHTVGTGWDIPDGATWVGMVQDGDFVWHVYLAPAQAGAA